MPRTPRIVLEGVPHHVVQRGNNRRRLFSYPRDYRYFVRLLTTARKHCDFSIHALCLMPNHTHILVTPHDRDALPALVKRVAQRYAQVRNKRFKTSGKLFEQRYYSRPIQSEAHLAVATAYIDLNPVRAGLVDDGTRYPWSTFRLHAGKKSHMPGLGTLWQPTAWYRALGNTPSDRAIAFEAWAAECRARDEWEGVRRDPPTPKGPAPTRPDRRRAAG